MSWKNDMMSVIFAYKSPKSYIYYCYFCRQTQNLEIYFSIFLKSALGTKNLFYKKNVIISKIAINREMSWKIEITGGKSGRKVPKAIYITATFLPPPKF